MPCRHCGTEIADKALICFKCGAATAEPTVKAPGRRTSSIGWQVALFAGVLLALLALFVLYEGPTPSGLPPQAAQWAIVAGAVAIVILRAIARRRR